MKSDTTLCVSLVVITLEANVEKWHLTLSWLTLNESRQMKTVFTQIQ